MRKILITGGTGFVGANFVRTFLGLGDDVHLIVRPESNFWRIEDIKNSVTLHYVDLLNASELEAFIIGLKPEIILHFATYGAYPGRQQDVKLTADTNVLGTMYLANAASKIPCKCFINTGSSSEYGEKNCPMSEDDLLEPNNLYGITKAAGTLYCQFLAKSMELPMVTMRLFSVYGYFEDVRRLMPAVALAGLNRKVFTSPSPSLVRDFIFIEDVISAYMKVIDSIGDIRGNIFNIGSGMQHSIAEVADGAGKALGYDIKTEYGNAAAKQHEPKQWVADISKAKKILHWEPAFSLEKGIAKNIAWFQNHISLYSV